MRVLCIKKDGWKWLNKEVLPDPKKDPSFGEILLVTNSRIHPTENLLIYLFDGYKDWYDSKNFIPLSEIDETEMIREKLNQTA